MRQALTVFTITASCGVFLTSCSGQPDPDPGSDAQPRLDTPVATGIAEPGTSTDDSTASSAAAPSIDRLNQDALMRQWVEAKAQCHTDNGFPAVAMPDGGIETNVAPGQDEDYNRVTEQCDAQVRAQLGPPPVDIPFTAEELSARYDLLLEQKTCLESDGYTVTEPSTRQTYIDKSQRVAAGDFSQENIPWDPLRDINDPVAQEQCPSPSGQDVAEHLSGSNN